MLIFFCLASLTVTPACWCAGEIGKTRESVAKEWSIWATTESVYPSCSTNYSGQRLKACKCNKLSSCQLPPAQVRDKLLFQPNFSFDEN